MSRRQHYIALLSILQFFSSFCLFCHGPWTWWELINELDKYVPFMIGHLQSLIIHAFNRCVVFRCICHITFIHFFFCWLPSGLISFPSYLFWVRQKQKWVWKYLYLCSRIYIPLGILLSPFIMNECSIFPSFIEKILWILPLALSRCCLTFIDVYVFSLTGICGMKPTEPWCVVFTNLLLNLFCVFFSEYFLDAYSLGLMIYVLFRFFPYMIF